MGDNSAIEWTDATWNPIAGCEKVSPGCAHCYAEAMGFRLRAMALAEIAKGKDPGRKRYYIDAIDDTGRWTGVMIPVPEILDQPLRWKKPRKIFVNSMSDLFHPDVDFDFIDEVFAVMGLASQHVFQVLTKRAARMHEYFATRTWGDVIATVRHINATSPVNEHDWRSEFATAYATDDYMGGTRSGGASGRYVDDVIGERFKSRLPQAWPLPNVCLGVSVENADQLKRVEKLCQTPAAVRFVSAEPLLGPVDFTPWLHDSTCNEVNNQPCICSEPREHRLDWVIVGGESGPGSRPMHPDWARDVRDQCLAAGVPFLFKQWGEWKPISEMPGDESSELYVSKRRATRLEDQDNVDEIYGRRCIVETETVRFDGKHGNGLDLFQMLGGHPGYQTFKLGKHASGRQLDGREWNGFPRVEVPA